MSTPTKQKYRTTNWKAYNAALKQRGSLLIWVDQDMCWYEAAIQFCLTIKGLFNLALRQATGMAQSLLKLAGLDWEVPDFSTVSRRQKYLSLEISANATTTGLQLLVDSTGIKMLGEGEWKTKKHGTDYRRQWRKMHLGIDATTLEIRAIEVTDNATGDAPMLSHLLDQIGTNEVIASVSGDGAYDTKGCHDAIARRGAHAVIPTRKNGKPWKDHRPGAAARNDMLHAAPWSSDMEEMERLPSAQSGGNQDALLQAARRTGDGARFRPPGRRATSARRHPQSLHPTRHSNDGGHGITPPGVRGISLSAYLCNKALLGWQANHGTSLPGSPIRLNR